jgi:hypothetical protein
MAMIHGKCWMTNTPAMAGVPETRDAGAFHGFPRKSDALREALGIRHLTPRHF